MIIKRLSIYFVSHKLKMSVNIYIRYGILEELWPNKKNHKGCEHKREKNLKLRINRVDKKREKKFIHTEGGCKYR